jgi:hypothetical protein
MGGGDSSPPYPVGVSETSTRALVISHVAAVVCDGDPGHPTRVAIDGVTASGKSIFASELTAAVSELGRPAIHLTMDGFHHHREHRYRRGRLSADGYYEDAYDFAALAELVLIPLGPGGDRRYRTRVIDLASDAEIGEAPVEAPADAVVIVDGSFLQRPELAGPLGPPHPHGDGSRGRPPSRDGARRPAARRAGQGRARVRREVPRRGAAVSGCGRPRRAGDTDRREHGSRTPAAADRRRT